MIRITQMMKLNTCIYKSRRVILGLFVGPFLQRSLNGLIVFFTVMFFATLTIAQDIKIYDKDYNLKYRTEGNRVYDNKWNLRYRIEDNKVYDKNWNLKYRIDKDKIYDKGWNLRYRKEENTIYDKDYNLKYRLDMNDQQNK
jgi:hypothetical protein